MVADGMYKENMFNQEKNPFLAELIRIVRFSPKMDIIQTIIDQKGVDYRDEPAQVLPSTYSPVTAMVLFLVAHLVEETTRFLETCLFAHASTQKC